MEEKLIEENGGGISLRNLLFVIKNNLIMIIFIIVFSTGCGYGFSYFVKPVYTASESVVYMAGEDEGGKGSTATYVNVMSAYFDTVVDFCKTGVVVDRANFYYVNYLNSQTVEPDLDINIYTTRVKRIEDPYSINKEPIKTKEVIKSNISTKVEMKEDDVEQFAFTISYKDANRKEAVEKLKCIILAFDLEIKSTGLDGQNKYFNGVKNNIISLGGNRVDSSVSQTKYALIGGFMGVILAAGVLYLTKVLDKTIRDKAIFEELTGSTVIAVIESEGGNA